MRPVVDDPADGVGMLPLGNRLDKGKIHIERHDALVAGEAGDAHSRVRQRHRHAAVGDAVHVGVLMPYIHIEAHAASRVRRHRDAEQLEERIRPVKFIEMALHMRADLSVHPCFTCLQNLSSIPNNSTLFLSERIIPFFDAFFNI